ncbi:MAG TPA: DUF4160 domain-containing protein [Thermodesulfobacteriota bacterium]|nr:DUF4160 domain-containing protein [Thermodesulfobacteriota bacterium]
MKSNIFDKTCKIGFDRQEEIPLQFSLGIPYASLDALPIPFRFPPKENKKLPELSRFLGILIRMFAEFNAPHHVTHSCAYYQEDSPVFRIDAIDIISGVLPKKQQPFVEAWAELHQGELWAGKNAHLSASWLWLESSFFRQMFLKGSRWANQLSLMFQHSCSFRQGWTKVRIRYCRRRACGKTAPKFLHAFF